MSIVKHGGYRRQTTLPIDRHWLFLLCAPWCAVQIQIQMHLTTKNKIKTMRLLKHSNERRWMQAVRHVEKADKFTVEWWSETTTKKRRKKTLRKSNAMVTVLSSLQYSSVTVCWLITIAILSSAHEMHKRPVLCHWDSVIKKMLPSFCRLVRALSQNHQ